MDLRKVLEKLVIFYEILSYYLLVLTNFRRTFGLFLFLRIWPFCTFLNLATLPPIMITEARQIIQQNTDGQGNMLVQFGFLFWLPHILTF